MQSITAGSRRSKWWFLWLLAAPIGAAEADVGSAFDQDVAAAVDDGLDSLRVSGAFDAESVAAREARGLSLLTRLSTPGGYATLDPAQRATAGDAARRLLEDELCGAGRGFGAYCHGAAMMALSLYARTGGPEVPNAGGLSLRAAIDALVDASLAQQTLAGAVAGFWGYTGPGNDASTTHFVASGLAAARGYYVWVDAMAAGSDGDARMRIGAVDVALGRTADGYARTRNADGGTPYQINGGDSSSAQQTAGALWVQLLGGARRDSAGVAASFGWVAARYGYETFASGRDEWRRSYYGYLWTSAMAFGHLDAADLGGVPGRKPLLDARPPVRGFGGVGYYADTPPSWSYDYGYTLMSQQRADGRFVPLDHGCWNDFACQAYAVLVLTRSLGGACVDADGDDRCDDVDNCPDHLNPDQSDGDGDGSGDACDVCPGEPDGDAVTFGDERVCPSVCAGNTPPVVSCPAFAHVPADDACGWRAVADGLVAGTVDAEGHRFECAMVHRGDAVEGVGLGVVPTAVDCVDECGARPAHPCETAIVPRDETPPRVTVNRPVFTVELADDWVYNWHQVIDECELAFEDNCSSHLALRRGIVSVRSDDPNEVIEGEPGLFVSDGIAVDWSGFMLNLDGRRAGPRAYTFDFAVGDEADGFTEVACRVEVVAGADAGCDGVDDDGDGLVDEDYIARAITCGEGACVAPGHRICDEGVTVDVCVPGAPRPETCDGVDDDCDGMIDNGFAVNLPCDVGIGACARSSLTACIADGTDVTCDAEPAAPADEICNGLDDDCDGTADEGDACDSEPPTIELVTTADVVDPGEVATVTATAVDESGVAALDVFVDGASAVLDAAGALAFASDAPGLHTVSVIAVDGVGNRGEASIGIRVRDPDGAAQGPWASIATPTPGEVVDGPLVVRGTAFDDAIASYRLTWSPAHLDGEVVVAHSVRGVASGPLGTVPTDRLPPNAYDLRLEVETIDGRRAEATHRFVVGPSPRLGVHRFCHTDHRVPLGGRAFELGRCFDGGLAVDGGFGLGWSAAAGRGHVAHDRRLADGWRADLRCTGEDGGVCVEWACAIEETEPHLTWAFLADGADVRGWAFRPEITDVTATAAACAGRIVWHPVAETPASWTLTGRGAASVELDATATTLRDALTGDDFSAAAFALAGPEDATWGLDDRGLEYVGPRGGGRAVEWSADGVRAVAGAGLSFERDASGRVVNVTDDSGAVAAYVYDAAGWPTTVTDPAGGVRTYAYGPSGELVSATDALGERVGYGYDDGRLIEIERPDGAIVGVAYEVDARTATYDVDGERSSVHTFDAEGRLVAWADGAGRTHRWRYDEAGRTVAYVDPAGAEVTATYDARGRRTALTDPTGAVSRASWDDRDFIDAITDPAGNRFEFSWRDDGHPVAILGPDGAPFVALMLDADGRPIELTNGAGETAELTYDEDRHLVSLREPGGGTWHFGYDAAGRPVTEQRPDGGIWRYEYDDAGRMIRAIDPAGTSVGAEYDATGRPTAWIDRAGHRTELEYDATGQVTAFVFADDAERRVIFDASGRPIAHTDALGRTRRTSYDAGGRIAGVEHPDGSTERLERDAAGRVVRHVGAAGEVTDYEWDAAGRLAVISGADGRQTRIERDPRGAVSRIVDPAGEAVDLEYDGFGRLSSITESDGAVEALAYDAGGRLVSYVDGDGRTTELDRDAAGRLVGVGLGGLTALSYTRDAAGRATAMTDGLGRETGLEYDAMGRPVRITRPGGGVEVFTYDAHGDVVNATRASGAGVAFTRDIRHRVTRIEGTDGQIYDLAYAPPGTDTTVTDDRGATSWTRDLNGRITAVEGPDGARLELRYDSAGRVVERAARAAANGEIRRTAYAYDALGQLVTVVDSDGGETAYAYDLRGLVTAIDRPNGARTEYDYDGSSRISAIRHIDSAGDAIETLSLTRDLSGRVTAVDQADIRREFAYDAAGRLIREIRTGGAPGTTDFTYDAAGNITAVDDSVDGRADYVYDVDDRLISGAGALFDWDADGQLVRREDAWGVTTYVWDAFGRLISIQRSDGGVHTYAYDVTGNRIEETLPDGRRLHRLVDTSGDLPRVVLDYDDDGAIVAEYTHGTGLLRRATVDGAEYYHFDWLASVGWLTANDGSLADQYDYTPYGTTRRHTGTSDNPYRFAGHRFDGDTGLVDMGARAYDPAMRRFISPDRWPARADSPVALNRYAYADADPINLFDPTGHIVPVILGIAKVALIGLRIAIAVPAVINVGAMINEGINRGVDRMIDNAKNTLFGQTGASPPGFPAEGEKAQALCRRLIALIEADAAADDPLDIVEQGADYDFTSYKLPELNYDYPSIYGPVDIDWMLRVSFYGVPRRVADAVSTVTGTEGGAVTRVATSAIYFNGKTFWNLLRPLGEDYTIADWDFSSLHAESNRNTAQAAAEWASGRTSLADMFRPSLQHCEQILDDYTAPDTSAGTVIVALVDADGPVTGGPYTVDAYLGDDLIASAVTAGEDNEATFELEPGVYRFQIARDGLEYWSEEHHRQASDPVPLRWTFGLPRLAVTVVDPDGGALANQTVAMYSDAQPDEPLLTRATDAWGIARFPLGTGRYRVAVVLGGGTVGGKWVVGRAGGPLEVDETIVVPRLEITPHDADGALSLYRLRIVLYRDGQYVGYRDAGGGRDPVAKFFVGPGSYRASTTFKGSTFSVDFDIAEGEGPRIQHDLWLLRLDITIADVDGPLLRSKDVTLYRDGVGVTSSQTVHTTGTVKFWTSPGRYEVFSSTDAGTFRVGVVDRPPEAPVVFEYTATLPRIDVTLRDAAGEVFDGRRPVHMYRDGEHITQKTIGSSYGNNVATAKFHVSAGTYRFSTSDSGSTFWTDDVVVTEDGPMLTAVDLVLKRTEFRLHDIDGSVTRGGARVYIERDGERLAGIGFPGPDQPVRVYMEAGAYETFVEFEQVEAPTGPYTRGDGDGLEEHTLFMPRLDGRLLDADGAVQWGLTDIVLLRNDVRIATGRVGWYFGSYNEWARFYVSPATYQMKTSVGAHTFWSDPVVIGSDPPLLTQADIYIPRTDFYLKDVDGPISGSGTLKLNRGEAVAGQGSPNGEERQIRLYLEEGEYDLRVEIDGIVTDVGSYTRPAADQLTAEHDVLIPRIDVTLVSPQGPVISGRHVVEMLDGDRVVASRTLGRFYSSVSSVARYHVGQDSYRFRTVLDGQEYWAGPIQGGAPLTELELWIPEP